MASNHSLGSETHWQQKCDKLFEKIDKMPEKKQLLFIEFLEKLLEQEQEQEQEKLRKEARRQKERLRQ